MPLSPSGVEFLSLHGNKGIAWNLTTSPLLTLKASQACIKVKLGVPLLPPSSLRSDLRRPPVRATVACPPDGPATPIGRRAGRSSARIGRRAGRSSARIGPGRGAGDRGTALSVWKMRLVPKIYLFVMEGFLSDSVVRYIVT